MAVTITDQGMTSDLTGHTATSSGVRWRVSWLPGRDLDRNQAVTAMMLAETVTGSEPPPGGGNRSYWALLDGWAAELGLATSEALRHLTEAALADARAAVEGQADGGR